jgi:hypothetical protein
MACSDLYLNALTPKKLGRKTGLVVSKLDSRLEGLGFESHPILDGNVVKAMPGLIPTPNPGSFND